MSCCMTLVSEARIGAGSTDLPMPSALQWLEAPLGQRISL